MGSQPRSHRTTTRRADRIDAGYHRFQRSVARTTDRLDLRRLAPRLGKQLRRRRAELPVNRTAVIGAATLLAAAGAVVVLLSGGDETGAARVVSAPLSPVAAPADFTVTAVAGGPAAFVNEPAPLPDGNSAGPAEDPLQSLLGAFSPRPGSGPSSTATGDAAGTGENGTSAPVAAFAVPELRRLFDLTNLERASHGAAPVAADASLTQTAQRHADWMASHGELCHSNECNAGAKPDGSIWNGWGENIGYAVSPDPDELQQAFVRSTPHLTNMVDPRHKYAGLGWARGFNEQAGTVVYYVVVQFGMNKR